MPPARLLASPFQLASGRAQPPNKKMRYCELGTESVEECRRAWPNISPSLASTLQFHVLIFCNFCGWLRPWQHQVLGLQLPSLLRFGRFPGHDKCRIVAAIAPRIQRSITSSRGSVTFASWQTLFAELIFAEFTVCEAVALSANGQGCFSLEVGLTNSHPFTLHEIFLSVHWSSCSW